MKNRINQWFLNSKKAGRDYMSLGFKLTGKWQYKIADKI